MNTIYEIIKNPNDSTKFALRNRETNKIVGYAETEQKATEMLARVLKRRQNIIRSDPTMKSPFVRHFISRVNT
jgi:hypothetical protein